MQAVVQKWGNSLGFRIPSLWAKDNNVRNGSKIEVIAEKGKMIILPQKKSLDDMMAMVTGHHIRDMPKNHVMKVCLTAPFQKSLPLGKLL